MRALNRAIEDAADFSAFRDALTRRNPNLIEAEQQQPRDGENRAQRRARERAERKTAQKTKARA